MSRQSTKDQRHQRYAQARVAIFDALRAEGFGIRPASRRADFYVDRFFSLGYIALPEHLASAVRSAL